MNRPFLVWLLLSTVWGSTWLFIKVGLAYLPPFTFAGVRFVVALIPLVILLLIRRPLIPKKLGDWALIFITGFITFSVNYGLVFWGENHISSGLTAILYTTMPLFGLVMAHFVIPSEPMNVFKVAGVLLGIFGVSVIFSNQLQLENTAALWGVTAIVVAAITTAYADILIKVRGKHLDPLVLTVGQMLVGFGPLLLVGWTFEGNPLSMNWNVKAWLALIYLALIGSSLTFVLLYWLIKKMDVTKTLLIPLASTLIAVLLGTLVLDEQLNWRTSSGGMCILLGLVITYCGYKQVAKKTAKLVNN